MRRPPTCSSPTSPTGSPASGRRRSRRSAAPIAFTAGAELSRSDVHETIYGGTLPPACDAGRRRLCADVYVPETDAALFAQATIAALERRLAHRRRARRLGAAPLRGPARQREQRDEHVHASLAAPRRELHLQPDRARLRDRRRRLPRAGAGGARLREPRRALSAAVRARRRSAALAGHAHELRGGRGLGAARRAARSTRRSSGRTCTTRSSSSRARTPPATSRTSRTRGAPASS